MGRSCRLSERDGVDGGLHDSEDHAAVLGQGRFITQLMQGGTLIVVTNESAFARRFAAMPERLAQRREAWRGFCAERGARWLSADLESSV